MTLEDTVIGHHLSSISSGHPGGRPFQLSGSERRPQPIFPGQSAGQSTRLSPCSTISQSSAPTSRRVPPFTTGYSLPLAEGA